MALSALELLIKQMEEHKESSVNAVLSGAVNDFAKYKELCGFIRGLATAQVLVQAMNDKMQKDED